MVLLNFLRRNLSIFLDIFGSDCLQERSSPDHLAQVSRTACLKITPSAGEITPIIRSPPPLPPHCRGDWRIRGVKRVRVTPLSRFFILNIIITKINIEGIKCSKTIFFPRQNMELANSKAKCKLKASQRQLFNKNRLLPTLDLFKK